MIRRGSGRPGPARRGQGERVGVVDLGDLLAGYDLAHTLVTSFVPSRERTQGRPEVPAPAAPPPSARAITPPARQDPGRRRGTVLGGEPVQLGRVPGHGLGQQAAERHVVLGDLAPAGVGDRDVRRAVVDGQDRRGVVVGAAAGCRCWRSAGRRTGPWPRRPRRTGPMPMSRSCRHLPAAGQRHQVRPLRRRHRAGPRPWRSACTGPARRAAAAGPGTGVRPPPRTPTPWRRAAGRSPRARPRAAPAG